MVTTTLPIDQTSVSQSRSPLAQKQREQIKCALRQNISTALQTAQALPPAARLQYIRASLATIQADCQAIAHPFIVVEMATTCDQYDLRGHSLDKATLFRGPSETASVAICVTAQGSLLHRNGDTWQVYRNAGDVNPIPHAEDRAAA
jgi:hypothetical protein